MLQLATGADSEMNLNKMHAVYSTATRDIYIGKYNFRDVYINSLHLGQRLRTNINCAYKRANESAQKF